MKKRIFKSVFFFLALIIFLVGYYIFYSKTGIGIPCVIHKVTGFYCPGCGITRLLFALFRGHIKEAFMYNQLVFILLPFLIFYIIYSLYLYITAKEDKILKRIPNYVFIILLVIVLVWGVVRNLSFFPFLRP